ncbi:MAG: type II toxin-antitoxin system RelE/ParE family toxin [Verrucomicrobia bacterium]|nr:type II toxin-antitoxin system RelE/ParE family toxin [Verrucomicrobiota bacterium]
MTGYGFHPDAQREFTNAIHYYLEKDPQLAGDFISAIDEGLQAIRTNPETWRLLRDNIRRYLIRRFPFGIYYTYENRFLTVWAVHHLNRKPEEWIGRLD